MNFVCQCSFRKLDFANRHHHQDAQMSAKSAMEEATALALVKSITHRLCGMFSVLSQAQPDCTTSSSTDRVDLTIWFVSHARSATAC